MMYALYNVYMRYRKIHGGKTDEKEENFNVGMYGSIGSNSCYTSKCGKKNKQKTDSSIKSISGSSVSDNKKK